MNTLIAIAGLAVLVLIAEIVNLRKLIIPMSIIGLLTILGITLNNLGIEESYFDNMIVVNRFSVGFSSLFILLTTFLIALSNDFYKEEYNKISDYVSLKLFILVGAVSLVSFGNMAMFFLGLEVLSISLYILAGSNRTNIKSNEAGMKYFLLGSFASGIVLFGIALIYGSTASFDIDNIYIAITSSPNIPQWHKIGAVMMIVGMLFKIAAFPFHFWAPDVYQGSPNLITALMSTLAKVAAVATLYKLSTILTTTLPETYTTAIVVISIATMTVGNIMALRQDNIKRLLAYSGISHAGFMMMALVNLEGSASSLLYYAVAYSVAGIAAFSVIILVNKNKEDELISNFNGLGKISPVMAMVLSTALLSMGGIPIFAGFFGKFFLFTQALENNQLTLVLFGVVNSFISIYYYFKIIGVMYTKEPSEDSKTLKIPIEYYIVGIISILINIIIGICPSIILNILK